MTLKFRTWDEQYQTMLYYTLDELIDCIEDCSGMDETWMRMFRLYNLHQNDYRRPMVCVGQVDMDGTGIYEGDIVQNMGFDYYGCIDTVKYDPNVLGFMIDTFDSGDDGYYDAIGVIFSFNELKVIGNIYENPELLVGLSNHD